MEVGRKYRVKPEMITGKDGVVYPVFTVQAAGRGWEARNYYTPGAGVDCSLDIEVLPHDGYKGGFEKATKVKVLNGGEIKMYRFNKKPYVRKDGSFTVIVPDFLTGTSELLGEKPRGSIASAYGFWRNEGYLTIKKGLAEAI